MPRLLARNQDCRIFLPELPSESVDVLLTSPPFKKADGFSYDLMEFVAGQASRILKPGGVAFVNFGALVEQESRPMRVGLIFEDSGLSLYRKTVWLKHSEGKGHFCPLPPPRLNRLHEDLFIYTKGKKHRFSKEAIGVPYSDPANARRWKSGAGGRRCRGDVWFVPYATVQRSTEKRHKDMFPIELAEMCLKFADRAAGSVVCDPFAGSLTVAEAALALGHQFVGCELNPEIYERGMARFSGSPMATPSGGVS